MNRAIITSVLVVVVLTSVTGLAFAESNILSPSIENNDGMFGLDNPDDVVRYGTDSTPSWIITVSEGEQDSLRTWVDESEQREIKEWPTTQKALVVAPTGDVLDNSFFNDKFVLSEAGYVETISYNLSTDLIEPVEEFQNETPERYVSILAGGEFGTGQISEVETTTLQNARTVIADNQVASEGEGVTVGIVDTGVNTGSNSELYGSRIVEAKNTITGNTGVDAVADGNGHGSWVASAVAANSADDSYDGVANSVDLVIAKSLDDSGSGETADIIEGVEYTCERADIVNLSLGTMTYSEEINDAVQTCEEEHNTTVVIAAGNSGEIPEMMLINSPANSTQPGAITVGASNTDVPSDAKIATFSSVGPDRGLESGLETTGETVDVAAPGIKLEAQVATEDGSIETEALSGTSMASPIVTGSIAVAMASDSTLQNDPAAVRERIETTSPRMPNAAVNETNYGMINVDNLVSETTVDESQQDAMNTKAAARNEFYESYSKSRIIKVIKNGWDI